MYKVKYIDQEETKVIFFKAQTMHQALEQFRNNFGNLKVVKCKDMFA